MAAKRRTRRREPDTQSDPLSEAIATAEAALDALPKAHAPAPPWDELDQSPEGQTPPSEATTPADSYSVAGQADTPRLSEVNSITDPQWGALRAMHVLLELVPDSPQGHTRLGQCVGLLRNYAEQDLFQADFPDAPWRDSSWPITYPRREANWIIDAAKPVILGLLDSVDVENGVRKRLARELQKASPYLEPDDRGTIEGHVEPTGMTAEKERNNARLDALSVFLDSVRRQPYAVIRYAVRLLRGVAVPPSLLSTNRRKSTVTYRSTEYKVSDAACHFVGMLLAAEGGFVSTGDLRRDMERQGLETGRTLRAERLKDALPDPLARAIHTDNRGSRLDVDRLLSDA